VLPEQSIFLKACLINIFLKLKAGCMKRNGRLRFVSYLAFMEILDENDGNILHIEYLKYYHDEDQKRHGKDIKIILLKPSDPKAEWKYKIKFPAEEETTYLNGEVDLLVAEHIIRRSEFYGELAYNTSLN
jgi:hypothetical protein